MHILLAEDDKNFGIVLKNELEEERYTVDLVGDGVEAILGFIEKSYDFVLIDIKMPKLDGINTLKIIKKLKPGIPVITFSGNAETNEIEESLICGALKYLSKPFEVSELKYYLRKFLLNNSLMK